MLKGLVLYFFISLGHIITIYEGTFHYACEYSILHI